MVRSQALPVGTNTAAASTFSLDKVIAHVTHKANYKQLGNGFVCKKTGSARLRVLVEGNAAADRYRRNAFEASQRVSGVMLAEKYRASQIDPSNVNPPDWSTNTQVQSRFWRQDNIRFDARLHEHLGEMSKRDGRAVRLSVWAQHLNGLTELCAAPTGLLLKSTRLALQPKTAENTLRSQARVLAVLGPIAALVALIGIGMSQKGIGRLADYTANTIATDIRALIGSFSALGAVTALISLGLTAASSSVGPKSPLRRDWVDRIQTKQKMHIERLHLMLNDAKDKPNAQVLIQRALARKISQQYKDAAGNSILLNRLLLDVSRATNVKAARAALEKTIGAYLTEADPTGIQNGQLLDPAVHKAELLRRENHFVALTNLIEHARIDEEKKNPGFRDLRHKVESGVKGGRGRLLACQSPILHAMGFHRAAERAAYKASDEYHAARAAREKNPAYAACDRMTASRVLEKSHQYGPVTVFLARASESLRVFNHGIVLSLNYQLTRPIAWVAGRLTEGILKEPNSRCASFSIGRFVASSFWAVTDAFLLISLAGGRGVGLNGPEASVKVTFPLRIPLGVLALPVSIVSTAAQMIVVAIPAAMLMSAAKVACHFEGWKGNVGRTADTYDGRGDMEAWSKG